MSGKSLAWNCRSVELWQRHWFVNARAKRSCSYARRSRGLISVELLISPAYFWKDVNSSLIRAWRRSCVKRSSSLGQRVSRRSLRPVRNLEISSDGPSTHVSTIF